MDFSFDEDQIALAALAREMLTDLLTPQRHRDVAASTPAWDAPLWRTLADTGLVGIALPEACSGSARGMVEACLVAREIGRSVAPIPYSAVVATATALAGLPERRRPLALLAEVSAGRALVVPAVPVAGEGPALELKPAEGGWTAHGTVPVVPYATVADRLLVAVGGSGGAPAAVLLDPRDPEVVVEPLLLSSGDPAGRVSVSGLLLSADDVLDGPTGAALLDRARLAHLVLGAAETCGLAEAALRLTAAYTGERRQFGRPLGSFQAVASRAADGFIDLQAMTWTMWKAADALDAGSGPAAREAVSVARFWAADGGHRVLSAAQHLHGGVGIDLDYPLHRYFLRGKQLEFGLGGAAAHLDELGHSLAARTGDAP